MFQTLRNRRARTLIKEATEEWFISISGLAYTTRNYYKRTILEFTINLSKKYIFQITSADLRRYLTKFRWENHKASTTNNHLMALKAFCRFLTDNYGIQNISQSIRKFKEEIPHRPFISKKDLDKILASATQKESDIIKILAHTGMRCSELCGLRPENISPNLSSITIQGKGGKVRTIPCNQTVREILSRSIHFPKNRKTVYTICSGAGIKTGVSLAPHMLRRFFATSLLNKGVSLLIISRLLGHASVRQTEIYLSLDSSFLLGCTNCLD